MKKDDREIMNILEAFDLTGSAHSVARLAGCDPKTVRHWVAARDRGMTVGESARREKLIDPFLAKVEEWVDRSKGQVRADAVHERLVAVGFGGDEHAIRCAVAGVKARWRAGRTYVLINYAHKKAAGGARGRGGRGKSCSRKPA